MRGMTAQFAQKYSNLIQCFEEGLAVIVLNRPRALNALNAETIDQLDRALSEVEEDPNNRVLLLTGAGDRAFVAGADITELKDANTRSGKKASQTGQKLFRRLEQSRLFTIAGINGFALGGGFELALACDIRVASETAIFGLPEVGLGIIPGYGGTQRLPRLAGPGLALELICTGRKFDAPYAQRIGVVNQVVPAHQLLEVCRNIAREVMAVGPLAVEAAKRCIHKGLDTSLDEGLKLEAREFGQLCGSEDKTEGMTAFLEKRAPNFQGK